MQPSTTLPPLAWLRAFEAAARHLSFTLAAREIHITQSAVSQHVRNLESYLGCQLFIRKTRAIELTEAGENYLPIITSAFQTISAGTRSVIKSDPQKNLNIHCNMAFSAFWLTPRLAQLDALLPSINLSLTTPIWDPERIADNAAVEIRFGLSTNMPDGAIRLTRDHYYPVGSPQFKGSLETSRLFDCAGTTANWDNWMAGQNEVSLKSIEVNYASTYVVAIGAALNNAGLSMAHDTLVSRLLEQGQLIKPFAAQLDLKEAYFLIPPSSGLATPATEIFCDWILRESSIAAD
ncbi:MAG: LysR family transcriptional regulator [Pseudomonadota bacterium]